ncbi:hypothetical protein PYW08_012801 [Mythimna loreyi]|uniref:Uncharacterized protein n=1 Tax=Mythimna loreyi TaxID=667449 RepID=A0ACC2Q4T6_9NEOP|nr:hypothetical protein PYW08_012801 [Mythimna loreyi]
MVRIEEESHQYEDESNTEEGNKKRYIRKESVQTGENPTLSTIIKDKIKKHYKFILISIIAFALIVLFNVLIGKVLSMLAMFTFEQYEVVKDYTDCKMYVPGGPLPGARATKCKDFVKGTDKECICSIQLEIKQPMTAPVTAYYELDDYDEFNSSYSQSRDDNQLAGHLSLEPSESCGSYTYPCMNESSIRKPIAPCGGLADAMFNDEFAVYINNKFVLSLHSGLISEEDKKLFHNPLGQIISEAFKNFAKPMSWTKKVWELDTEDPNNNGFQNEQFIAWMKTDLKRKPIWRVNHTGRYEEGMPPDNYTLKVTYVYPTSRFGGRRRFIIRSQFDDYEVVKDYTDCKIPGRELKCRDNLYDKGQHCTCHIDLEIKNFMKAPIFVYYELDAYDEIVRRYSKSRDDNQLAGHLSLVPSESCGSYTYVCFDSTLSRKPIAPCGRLADAMFNDTFNLDANNEPVPYSSYGLISEDQKKLYQNPEPAGNLSEAFKNYSKPLSWKKNVWELDPSNPDNNGFRNEQFIIWMKTDLKRKPVWRVKHTGRYETGLPAGNYTLRVTYGSTPIFDGRRKFIMVSTEKKPTIDPKAISAILYIILSLDRQDRSPSFVKKHFNCILLGVAIFGVILSIVGISLPQKEYVTFDKYEIVKNYTDCKTVSTYCTDHKNTYGHKCSCSIQLEIKKTMEVPVTAYYELDGYDKIISQYSKSRDNYQLAGHLTEPSESCGSHSYVCMGRGARREPIAPCGRLADAMFNDTFTLKTSSELHTVLTYNYGLITEEDKKPFHNPETSGNLEEAFRGFSQPLSWKKNVWELDPSNPDNNGFRNEQFIIWMKTDLKRKPIWRVNHTGIYEKGLPAGNYTLGVEYVNSTQLFGGRRKFIVSSSDGYEVVKDYTDCIKIDTETTKCKDYVGNNGGYCSCHVGVEINTLMKAPVTAYYELDAYDQIVSSYSKSRDDDQLAGHLSLEPSDSCGSYTYTCMTTEEIRVIIDDDEGSLTIGDEDEDPTTSRKPIAPCGRLADAMLHVKFNLEVKNEPVPYSSYGLISEDEKKQFQNPEPAGNLSEAFKNFTKPVSWKKNVWELDPSNPDNNGFRNEQFIIWMKTDLKRKPVWRVNHTGRYETGLQAGSYTLRVIYGSSTHGFIDRLKFILSSKVKVVTLEPNAIGVTLLITRILVVKRHSSGYVAASRMTFNCDKMANQYLKRQGTSGIRGLLYESKLLSLIYFRAIHDNNIEEFHLATNVNNLGSFDDICFKTKFEDNDKPLAVFVQAKHRENNDSVLKLKESDLVKYFNSYLKVRRKFNCNEKDVLFNSTLSETECLFVIYTNAKSDKKFRTYEGRFSKHLNNLIGTGVPGSQFSHDMNVELLCEILLKEQMEALAQQLAKFISKESDSEMSMNNDLMSCYHVILALNVFDVSEIQPEGHRIASFREDFFTTNDEYITPFKHKLCLGVLKKQKLEDIDTQRLLLTFLKNPSDVDTLSKLLIGSVLKYKSDKLEFVSKSVTGDQKRQLDKANVLQSTVYEAAELATKEYLLSLKLKVPAFFGNKDLAIRGNENKIQKRLDHLTTKIKEILKQSNPHHIVTIDGDEESMEGILQLNGGIASAVGNILVFDETSKLLKFTDTYESLGKLAKTWYETLTSEIPNLHEYRLDIKAKLFPKLSFATDEYNRTIVSSFLNTILFFTSQHNEKEVEKVLKQEIINSQGDDVHVKNGSDAIYLKYHDEIQRWSMESDLRKGTYLDKEGFIYKDAVKHVKTQPLMGVINTIKLIDMSAELQKQILENNKVIFQGNEVNLGHFLNNSSIDHIGGDVLYNIMNGNKNTVGKPVSTFKFKPELYIQRRVRPFCRDTKKQENVDCKQIQTLSNLEENVTIIFGDPGMGKSSLLTDFSLKMKEGVRGNTTWIVRLNLLEHTAQFKKWKDKNTKIGTTESLEFLCEVAISDVSRQTMDMNISLVESDDGTVLMTDFKGDAWTLFELRMFLNFYNSAQLIILLDGFDEICPTYENEVLALIEAVKKFSRTHKICITSRSYDNLVKTFENLEYCKLIEIEPLILDESDIYLTKCWDEKKVSYS